jgi:hypothetical protein
VQGWFHVSFAKRGLRQGAAVNSVMPIRPQRDPAPPSSAG